MGGRNDEWKEDGWKEDAFPSNQFNEADSFKSDSSENSDKSFKEDDFCLISEEERKAKQYPLPNKNDQIILEIVGFPGLIFVEFASSFTVGALFGGFVGAIKGAALAFPLRNNLGLAGVNSAVMNSAFGAGRLTGTWIGVYHSTTKGLEHYRKKKDIVNPMIAGFFAGSLAYLPTRNRAQIIYSGVSSAAFMGFMHLFSGENNTKI